METKTDVANIVAQAGAGLLGESGEAEVIVRPDCKDILAQAPTVHEVLARPSIYEEWLKKAQEALNG